MKCDGVVDEYHTLVRSTALFLQALDDVQVAYRFTIEGSVYDSLAYLQALWASRKPVSLYPSYPATCFFVCVSGGKDRLISWWAEYAGEKFY